MATLQNYISLRDGVSPMLEKMSRAAHTVSNKLNIASGSARNAGDSFGYAAEKAGLFKSILAGNIVGNVIMRGLDSIAGSISGAVALADEYTSLNARLALVAGSQSNVAALNDMIYESAQRARGGYMDMAKAVASLSVNARDAFPDPRKTVQFMEGMQKLFVIGGASKENQQFAMLQLQQSLASGRLQGDEFRSITENAPILQDMIAKTMKVSRGELKQLSAQGEITADIIKRAIFENMDEINDKFESMPKRWSDHFTDFKNVVLKSFAPIAERINRLANSEGVRSMFSMLKTESNLLCLCFTRLLAVWRSLLICSLQEFPPWRHLYRITACLCRWHLSHWAGIWHLSERWRLFLPDRWRWQRHRQLQRQQRTGWLQLQSLH